MTRKLLAGLAVLLVTQPALAQNGTRDGAVLGGVGGAVIGGIIGHQNKETPEGALIGGAVGAVAGGLIGNARDQQARERALREQQYRQHQYQHQHYQNYNTYRTVPTTRTTVIPAPGVTTADVLSMTRSGVGESVIINHIYTTGLQRRIDTNEIISLHQQGVSENVINAMQQAPLRSTYGSGSGSTLAGSSSTTIMTPPGGTVIVQEQYGTPTYAAPTYVTPSYVPSRPSYYVQPQRRGF